MALDDSALTAFLDLSFDHLCARPLSELVDADRILAGLDEGARSEGIPRFQMRVLAPLRERLLARAEKSAIKLGEWLPKPAAEALAAAIGAPIPMPAKLIDELVASEDVRDEVREMLQESLSTFIRKGFGAPAGIRDALGRGARAFGGLFGGLGDEVQRQMQERVRDFVDGSVTSLQERIARKLKSEAAAKSFGKRRKKAFEKALEKSEAEAVEATRILPHAALDALFPVVLRHNLARAELRLVLREEIALVLSELGRSTLGETLDDFGLRATARESLHAHGLPIARALVASDEFKKWWAVAIA
jgi:hypothetical protein